MLTTPVIRILKEQVQGAEIHYLTKKQYFSILENNPYIDKIHTFDGEIQTLISALKDEFFDHIIDLHNNLRSRRIKSNLPGSPLSFNKINFEKWLIVNFKINKLPHVHIVDRYLETVRFFDVLNDNKGLDYFTTTNDKVNISELPEIFHSGYVLFAIGAQHNTKKLPVEKIVSICSKISKPIIISGGPEDFENGEHVRNRVGVNVLNACGKYSLNGSASLIEQADVVISHDTGLMHISAAYKKKIISVWGNTIPEFGMYPYLSSSDSKIVEVKGLKCRPCSKIGFSRCPKKHFKCMNQIDEQEIVDAIN